MDPHALDTAAGQAAAAAGWPSLLLTCALMFLGAYGCGMLPGWLPNQQRLTASVSAVGAGLLLGSALCIILPEGFEAAMEAEPSLPGWSISGTLLAGFWLMLLLDSLSHWLPGASGHSHPTSHGLSHSSKDYRSLSDEELDLAAGDPGLCDSAQQGFGDAAVARSSSEHTVLLTDYLPSAGGGAARQGAAAAAAADAEGASAGVALHMQQQQQHAASRRPAVSPRKADRPGTSGGKGGTRPATAAAASGAHQAGSSSSPSGGGSPASALAAGGSLRRVVSGAGSSGGFGQQAAAAVGAVPAAPTGAGQGSSSGAVGGFDGLSRGVGTAAAAALKGRAGDGAAAAAAAAGGEWWRPWLVDPTHHALLGLLVHSVSDGLAVGAASLSTAPEVSLSVATAMVVHKGPVAVGLATFLRGHWGPAAVRRGVLLFAAASPLAALLTYGLLSAVPGVARNVPLVVLFSGGTVLYAAAMHILPGALGHGGEHGGSAKQQQQQLQPQHERGARRSQLLLVSLGMLLPLLLSAAFGGVGHHHH